MSGEDHRALSNAQLGARLHDLQKRAFEAYEDAALRAEANPALSAAIYAQAETDAAPLIAQARAINDERVQRLRRRARWWRNAAWVIAALGVGVVAWWLLLRK
ncbi:MAG: hypothetical protein ACOH1R_11850 [Luteimonas sp.]